MEFHRLHGYLKGDVDIETTYLEGLSDILNRSQISRRFSTTLGGRSRINHQDYNYSPTHKLTWKWMVPPVHKSKMVFQWLMPSTCWSECASKSNSGSRPPVDPSDSTCVGSSPPPVNWSSHRSLVEGMLCTSGLSGIQVESEMMECLYIVVAGFCFTSPKRRHGPLRQPHLPCRRRHRRVRRERPAAEAGGVRAVRPLCVQGASSESPMPTTTRRSMLDGVK